MDVLDKTVENGVATLTLGRPEKRNALNGDLLDALQDAFESLRHDDAVQCIVTRGQGPSFCSGMDLHYLKGLRGTHLDVPRKLPHLLRTIRHHPKVTIAQVHGYALGGGLVLINAHDLAFAATDAQIGMPEIIRGSFGRFATSSLFHSGVPYKKAFLMQLSGHNLTGEEASNVGLVSGAVEPAELDEYTQQMAQEIAGHDAAALRAAKVAALLGQEVDFETAMRVDYVVGEWMQLATDPYEAVDAYLDSQRGGTDPGYAK